MPVAPIEAVILGIDPAKHTSGATLLVPYYGSITEVPKPFDGSYAIDKFGKVVSQSERERFVQALLDTALELKLPPVVVAETWDPPRDRRIRLPNGETAFARDPKWTYETILGIGEGWGRWSAELESANEYLAEEGLPPLIVVRVTPNDWRDAVFGPRRAKDTEALKATASRYFEGVFGYAVPDDIAEAGCISLWGTTAVEVDTLMQERALLAKPRKRRKKAA